MPDELNRLLDGVRRDADAVVLGDPAALRRVGTRRSRVRSGLVVALAAIVLVTGSVAVNRVTTRGAPVVNQPPVPSVSSESASPEASRLAAIFADDPCSTDLAACRGPGRWWYEEKLPAPCSSTTHASDAQMAARQARTITPDIGNRSLRYGQTFVRYRGDGASKFVSELESALSRCSSVRRHLGPEPESVMFTLNYRKVASNSYHPDVTALLLSRTYTLSGRNFELLMMVTRVRDVIVVVSDMGMTEAQTSPTTVAMPRETFDAAVESSVEEARTW